jgi:hypothetical protein
MASSQKVALRRRPLVEAVLNDFLDLTSSDVELILFLFFPFPEPAGFSRGYETLYPGFVHQFHDSRLFRHAGVLS